MLGALAEGETHISGLLDAEDVSRTAECLTEMGVSISHSASEVIVNGRGEAGLVAAKQVMDAGNSGTTLRLLMGIAAGYPFQASFTGDASLRKRPMDRVAVPLRQMGAEINGQGERCLPPISMRGGNLAAIEYEMPMASAQVKSAILLAGLRAKGQTRVKEPGVSRDHTERMLKMFGADLEYGPGFAAINGGQALQARSVCVPGDFSAAAFFMVGAALVSGSEIDIEEVGLNPTRTGLLDVLREMGADAEAAYSEPEVEARGEPMGRVRVRGGGGLRGVKVGGELIPRLIDEIPILCVAAACAEGRTEIRGAQELRVKESDRLSTMAEVLRELGADVEELPDGLIIQGGKTLKRARIDSRGDHRVAMAAAVAALVGGEVEIEGAECISTSYPNFAADMCRLGAKIEAVE